MLSLGAEGYWLVRWLFQRGLALLYLLAFLIALHQFRPLVGEDGLLALSEYAENASLSERPSLLYLVPSDRAIGAMAWTGIIVSLFLLVGGPYYLPEPYPLVASISSWTVLWVLYTSFVNAGRVFYGYGWESMLLETGVLAIFLGAGASEPPVVVLWLLTWLLFRNMFGAGLIKLRGDDCWRDLSCMENHYETQPMPNPLSWHAHHLPKPFHRLEVLGNHVVELAIPFLYFAPQPYATAAGIATIGFQAWLMTTGNFAFLNALTIVQSVATFSDGTLTAVVPTEAILAVVPGSIQAVIVPAGAADSAPTPLALEVAAVGLTLVVLALSIFPVRNMLSSSQAMNAGFDPLKLVNTYGAFGSITKRRYQLVIQGTHAEDPDEDDWRAYECKGQPTRTEQRPRQWAPYHLRLDWQLWFAAMAPRPGRRQRWLLALLAKLLDGDEATRALFANDPFPDQPPRKVRVLRYHYEFTSPKTRRETGQWWTRTLVGTYVAPITTAELYRQPTVRHAIETVPAEVPTNE